MDGYIPLQCIYLIDLDQYVNKSKEPHTHHYDINEMDVDIPYQSGSSGIGTMNWPFCTDLRWPSYIQYISAKYKNCTHQPFWT